MSKPPPSTTDVFGLPFIVAAIALVAVAFYAACAAPCAWFTGYPIKDVPARCVEGFHP